MRESRSTSDIFCKVDSQETENTGVGELCNFDLKLTIIKCMFTAGNKKYCTSNENSEILSEWEKEKYA